MLSADLQMIKDIPGYKVILKAVIRSQIQQLVSKRTIKCVYLIRDHNLAYFFIKEISQIIISYQILMSTHKVGFYEEMAKIIDL